MSLASAEDQGNLGQQAKSGTGARIRRALDRRRCQDGQEPGGHRGTRSGESRPGGHWLPHRCVGFLWASTWLTFTVVRIWQLHGSDHVETLIAPARMATGNPMQL